MADTGATLLASRPTNSKVILRVSPQGPGCSTPASLTGTFPDKASLLDLREDHPDPTERTIRDQDTECQATGLPPHNLRVTQRLPGLHRATLQ